MRTLLALALLPLLACQPAMEPGGSEGALVTRKDAVIGAVSGHIPTGLPARLTVGLFEDTEFTWMKDSGVNWDLRYRYFTKGWVNNWGWGPADGAFAREYIQQCDAQGFIPTIQYYQLLDEPGGGESAVLAKVQNATTMRGYFSDFKVLMQRAKEFNKPVLVLVETDGFGFLQKQSLNNPNAYGAIADTGLPELAGLPNTVAGWGLAFLQMRKAVGANNVILALHVSGWASGQDIIHFALDLPLQAEVTKVHDYLKPFGLAPNVTGTTYDVLVTDPLDRDADYFQLVRGENRWWDPSDSAPLNTRSFNRYAEWLRLWNVTSGMRWILWQIPLGNSHHLNVPNMNGPREGYRDNRAEYFFGPEGLVHLEKFASSGVISLIFGKGQEVQSSYTNDFYTDGQLFMKSRAGNFLEGGGLAIPAGPTTGPTSPPNAVAPKFTSSVALSATSVPAGASVDITATFTATGGPLSNAIIDIEIYNAAGVKVGQKFVSGQAFFYGQSRDYLYTWTVPAPGTYTVDVGVFDSSWSGHHWTSTIASLQGAEPAPTSDSAVYHFESSAQNWVSSGTVTGVSASAARAWAGNQSLAMSMAGTAPGTGHAYVLMPNAPAGSTITFHLWVPSGHRISGVQPFVQEGSASGWRWTDRWIPGTALVSGAWTTLTVQVPADAVVPLHRIGLMLHTDAPWSDTIALDSVSW